MPLTRRTLMGAALLAGARAPEARPGAFGIASFTYAARLGRQPDLRDPLAFLRFCRERGAGGVQTGIPVRDAAFYASIRRYLDETGAWLEGQVRLPADAADVERFTAEVRAAQASGAAVVRSVMLSGRRYETFASAADFQRFRETSSRSVELALPVVERARMRLALENHKDYRADELAALLKRLGSEWVGVTLDTGNNLALLEDPMRTAEALAPLAFSVHLKDMAVEPAPEGFLLSEVPLGTGFLDLPRLAALLRRHRPEIRFSIEMATRDPLLVPCLAERYWATLEGVPAPDLAAALRRVRAGKGPLPRVEGLPVAERLEREDRNARECLAYAARSLAAV